MHDWLNKGSEGNKKRHLLTNCQENQDKLEEIYSLHTLMTVKENYRSSSSRERVSGNWHRRR